eukprot:gene16727-6365_t
MGLLQYSGALCGECAAGWGHNGGRCEECKETKFALFILTNILGPIIGTALVTLWSIPTKVQGVLLPVSLAKILLFHVQIVGMIPSKEIDWGDLQVFYDIASKLTIDVGSGTECKMGVTVRQHVYVWAALPVVLLVWAFLVTHLFFLCRQALLTKTVSGGGGGGAATFEDAFGVRLHASGAGMRSGVRVLEVVEEGAADRAGVAPGDLVVRLGRGVVARPWDVKQLEGEYKK